MKTKEKIRTVSLIIVIFLLISIILGNKPSNQVQNKLNLPDGYKAVMFYDTKSGKLFAKGYDFHPKGYHKKGLDSTFYVIDVPGGKKDFYFVLYDMAIEFKITNYAE